MQCITEIRCFRFESQIQIGGSQYGASEHKCWDSTSFQQNGKNIVLLRGSGSLMSLKKHVLKCPDNVVDLGYLQ